MRQYVVSETEMQSLIDQLKLEAMRAANVGPKRDLPEFINTPKQIHSIVVDDVHRGFHYVVVRWAQEMGFKGHHS